MLASPISRVPTLARGVSGKGDFAEPVKAICEVLSEVRALDMRSFEALPSRALVAQLCPAVQSWLKGAQKTVASVVEACEDPGRDPFQDHGSMTFEHRIDSLMVANTTARTLVADVAFVAGLELAQRLTQVSALSSEASEAEILTQCDSALRRIQKSLSALEHAIASLEGRPPKAQYDSELAVSLRVRAAYARLRAGILGSGDPTPQTLFKRMRSAGTQIAILVGENIYPHLRVKDRTQIRGIQVRILDWLRTPEPRDEISGMRLWQDVDSFLRMLSLVNKRQELVAHDVRQLELLSLQLSAVGSALPPEVIEGLNSLRGLDDELDTMLDNIAAVDVPYFQDVIERLALQFNRGSAPEWQ